MAYIKRAAEDTIARVSKMFPVLLVTGPRQVGKTTLLQRLAEIEPVARLERDTQKLENFYQHGYDLMEEKFEEMKWFLNR